MSRGWIVGLAALIPALVVVVVERLDDDPYVAEALVLVSPGIAAGRDLDGSAARDAAVVLQSEALVAYVRDELDFEGDPPLATGSVLDGTNVVVVRVESFESLTTLGDLGDPADPADPADPLVPSVADIANACALALVDVRGEQLRAGFGGAGAEIDRRLVQVEEQLAALNEELAVVADRTDPQVEALERARDAAERRRAALLERLDDTAVDGASTTGDLQIVRRAVLPTEREGESAWRLAWLSAVVGALAGLVILALVQAADRTRGRWTRGDRALAASGLSRSETAD